jgi:hypothetical protein
VKLRLPTKDEAEGLRLMPTRFPDGSLLTKDECAALEWLEELARALEDECAALEELVRALDEGRCTEWPVQLSDGCGGCPAGYYEECLVSRSDERVIANSDEAPRDCPLRNGGTVLLVGEP